MVIPYGLFFALYSVIEKEEGVKKDHKVRLNTLASKIDPDFHKENETKSLLHRNLIVTGCHKINFTNNYWINCKTEDNEIFNLEPSGYTNEGTLLQPISSINEVIDYHKRMLETFFWNINRLDYDKLKDEDRFFSQVEIMMIAGLKAMYESVRASNLITSNKHDEILCWKNCHCTVLTVIRDYQRKILDPVFLDPGAHGITEAYTPWYASSMVHMQRDVKHLLDTKFLVD